MPFFDLEVGELSPLLLDAGLLAGETAEIVEASPTNFADAVDGDLVDERRVHREDTLDTDAIGDLADGEALANTFALDLDNYALEDLNTLLVTLLDLVGDGNRVARLERRQLDATLEGVLSNLD